MKTRFRGSVATIYGKTKNYPFYRLAYRADGNRVVQTFKTLADAKEAAKAKAKELHARSEDPTAPVSIIALDDAIIEFIEAKRALGPRRLIEAVPHYGPKTMACEGLFEAASLPANAFNMLSTRPRRE